MNIKEKFLKGVSHSLVVVNIFSGSGLGHGQCANVDPGVNGKPSLINESKKENKLRKSAKYLNKNKRVCRGGKVWDYGNIKFYLPNFPQDLIQNYIVTNSDYFEGPTLRKLDKFIPEKAVILDIGANIGNHTLYWAMQNKIEKVYSFEPIEETFNILCKNVEINDLDNKVELFNIGLSDEETTAKISFFDKNNIGRTSIEKTTGGKIKVNKLDNIKINEERIDFVKIDVEGHEIKVLNGAKETFLKHKPKYVFIESFSNNYPKVKEILESYGYRLTDFPVECSNYLFEYKGKS